MSYRSGCSFMISSKGFAIGIRRSVAVSYRRSSQKLAVDRKKSFMGGMHLCCDCCEALLGLIGGAIVHSGSLNIDLGVNALVW